MILETDFTVPATPDRVWNALLDLDALGACLPGASLSRVDGDSTLQGAVRPQVNGSELPCIGTLRAVDADEDGRSASAALHMHQVGGPGFATALLRGTVAEADGGSRVAVSVDGRVAAPGVSEDASRPEAERLLGELAASLESSLAERASKAEPAPAPVAVAPTASADRPPLAAPAPAPSARRGPPVHPAAALGAVGAAGAVAVAAALLRGKRTRTRRGAWVEIRYRW
jgi:carbon monoxide dehydrogenase subunit G